MRQIIHAILLVALLELLWVAAESNGWESPGQWHRRALKVSAGFPLPSASYTAVRTAGNLPPGENYPDRGQWLPGLRISPVFLVLDVLAAVAAFFGFRWLLRFEAGRAAGAGLVLGLAYGACNSLCTFESWRPVAVWVVAPLLLAGLPLAVCFLTRRARSAWLPLLMLAVAAFVMPWMSSRAGQFKPDNGFSFAADNSSTWSPSLEEMLYFPLACMAVFTIPVLLIRRFVPSFRVREAVDAGGACSPGFDSGLINHPAKSAALRWAVGISLCLLALAIWHSSAQRQMVRQLEARYRQVERGMDAGRVAVIMDRDTFEVLDKHSGENLSGWWNDTPLDARDAARIETATCYAVPRLFGTTKYVFTFDQNDKLVGKHKFD